MLTSASSSSPSTTTMGPSSRKAATILNPQQPSPGAPVELEAEIVSEEEMAFIEAALASTRPLIASSRATTSLLSPCSSFCSVSRGAPPRCVPDEVPDVEASCGGTTSNGAKARLRLTARALAVTDLTRTEWCEKQVEFTLLHGKPGKTAAMRAGSDRHTVLEGEVMQRVNIYVSSEEDRWAVKFLNFIFGVNQLLLDGLTRELPVVGFLQGVWAVGIIDELRLNLASYTSPLLVDTKTRSKATFPSEAQKRNARLQLMCYKYLWDYNIANSFDTNKFLEHFNLNPKSLLSDEVIEHGASFGFQLKTFQDVFMHFREVSQTLSPSEDQMILRYEFQADNRLLGEDVFKFDHPWFMAQVQKCIEFLRGDRDASYVPDDERFKCRCCPFSSKCPRILTSKSSV